jgi:uncharacterized protein (DUF2141 family)
MRYLFTILFFLILTACANVVMPTGGPRDKTPPELISSNPKDNQLNFSEKTIELIFSEAIKLKDPKEEILIVPSTGKKTLFTARKDKLIIEPELELQPNTTYSINFRDGVQDLTEGNPAENLRLAFSTGPIIDSLSISGNVKEILIEKIPEKITVALYQADTFDIFKHTPTYFTKTNKEGNFVLPNLKPGDYYIYAMDDKNKNLKTDSKTEKFGFHSKPINLQEPIDSVELPINMVDSRKLALTSVRHTDKTSRLRFNKQLDSLAIRGISPEQSIYTYGTDRSEIVFFNLFTGKDSLKTQLFARDSIGNKIDTAIYIKHGDFKNIDEKFQTKELKNSYSFKTKKHTYQFKYNTPIKQIRLDSIFIRYDSITIKPILEKDIKIDTLKGIITIMSRIETRPIVEGEPPKITELVLGKSAFISINNDSSRQVKRPIKILEGAELATVIIKIETKVTNYIVELTDTNGELIESIKNVKDYTFRYLEPLEYKLRIILDENNNGKWDVGNFYTGTEPEKIILYKSEDGKYSFPLRSNWDYGPLLIKF